MPGEFIERDEIERGFAKVYREKIEPHLDRLREKRAAIAAKTQRDIKIIAGSVLIASIVSLIALGLMLGGFVTGLIVIFGFAGGLMLSSNRDGDFGRAVFDIVVPPITGFLRLQYERSGPDADFAASFKQLGVLPQSNDDRFQHHVRGSHRNTAFELTQAFLFNKEFDEERKRKQIFSGLAIRIQVPIVAPSPILIARDHGDFGNSLLESFSSSERRKAHRVMMEDADFEDRFAVYCESAELAQRFVTPGLMRQLIAIDDTRAESQKPGILSAAFAGDTFYLAIRRHTPFMETGSVFGRDLEERIHGIFRDMTLIHRVIDRLHEG